MAIKILVVEDEFELAENISDYLNQNGYDVIGIEQNEKEIFESIKKNLVDIVLVDIMLKGTQKGLEIAELIRGKFPNCGIVFTTALSSKEVLDRVSDTNYQGYLMKPFSLKSLDSMLYLTGKKLGLISEIEKKDKTKKLISIRENGRIKLINEDEIHFIKAEGFYLRIFTENKVYYTRELMKIFYPKLSSETFIRIQKSYIINMKKVVSFNSKNCLVLNQEITIRRGIYKELIEKISRLNTQVKY
jgi:DNA-binding LytR/AlgR family response regulator